MKRSKPNKLIQASLIVGLGMLLAFVTSYFFFWSVGEVHADIYWQVEMNSGAFLLRRFEGCVDRIIFGGPVTLNSKDGHYLVMEADQNVSGLLKQLKQEFSTLPPENITIGQGVSGGFFTAKMDRGICASMLIRDFNTNKTLLFTIIAPVALFRYPANPYVDQDGNDPVAGLRPPGSTRMFCFETPALRFAAYRSIQSNLTDFYENALSTTEIKGISIMSSTDAILPNNGNLFFFEKGIQNGCLAFQTSPEENCSYAIVCAQMN